MSAEVHELKPRDPDAPPVTRRRPPRAKAFCRHQHTEVDARHRELVCTDCGSDVDPFAFLEQLAHEVDRHTAARDRAKYDAERAQERLAEIKRLLANAQAALRRARRKGAAAS